MIWHSKSIIRKGKKSYNNEWLTFRFSYCLIQQKNNTLLYIPLNTKESLYQTFFAPFSKLNLILIRIQSLIPSTDRPKQTKYYPLKREAWHTTHYSFFNLLRYSNNKVIIHSEQEGNYCIVLIYQTKRVHNRLCWW